MFIYLVNYIVKNLYSFLPSLLAFYLHICHLMVKRWLFAFPGISNMFKTGKRGCPFFSLVCPFYQKAKRFSQNPSSNLALTRSCVHLCLQEDLKEWASGKGEWDHPDGLRPFMIHLWGWAPCLPRQSQSSFSSRGMSCTAWWLWLVIVFCIFESY